MRNLRWRNIQGDEKHPGKRFTGKMTIAFITNIVSPHRMPLSCQLAAAIGRDNYRYYYTEALHAERVNMGWEDGLRPEWCVPFSNEDDFALRADLFLSGHRWWDLMSNRAEKGLPSVYTSERWFKPGLGFLRILVPSYFRMAVKFVEMLSKSARIYFFPQGIHAARDMARLCGLLHGDLRCLFRAPKLNFECKPCGKIWLKSGGDGKKYCLDKMRLWGYFVEEGRGEREVVRDETVLRVLWVGRLLDWKRVDAIIKAVGELSKGRRIALDIYGIGPEEKRLKLLAAQYGEAISFYPPVPIGKIRDLMRMHDVYVLSSNAYEGWGAVVNEALEEGLSVLGTYEAGSSATILPESNLFHAGDWQGLKNLLAGDLRQTGIGAWSVKTAAKRLLAFCDDIKGR